MTLDQALDTNYSDVSAMAKQHSPLLLGILVIVLPLLPHGVWCSRSNSGGKIEIQPKGFERSVRDGQLGKYSVSLVNFLSCGVGVVVCFHSSLPKPWPFDCHQLLRRRGLVWESHKYMSTTRRRWMEETREELVRRSGSEKTNQDGDTGE